MPLILALLAQVTPVQPMLKGTGLPPPGTEEAGVMFPITGLLTALEKSDGAGVLAVTRADGGAGAALEAPDGKRRFRRMGWAEFAGQLKPDGTTFEERLGTPAIEIDGDVAMVWAPYTALAGGKITHCGYDHFDLVREGGSWKILNVTWSQRTTGCAVQP